MANQSQCLDDAPLGCRWANVMASRSLQEQYSEAQRLALEELVSGGPDAFRGFLKRERVPSFLSEPEVGEILGSAAALQCGEDEVSVSASVDCSSVTYFPDRSDIEPPLLELGWPAFSTGSYRGVTRVEVHFQPNFGETIYSCKEAAREMIRSAREVIAIVMDTFTDNDLFQDVVEACRKRRVAAYILLDQAQFPHFLTMCHNLGVSLEAEKNLRVRTLTGNNYYTRSGAKIVGKAHEKFLLVDGLKVATGSYSFTWTDGKLNSSNLIILTGQVVENFDLQFRVLYAQSKPISAKLLSSMRLQFVSLDCPPKKIQNKHISPLLLPLELVKLSSTPKRDVKVADAVTNMDVEDDWLQSCDIITGLKESQSISTQTEPHEGSLPRRGMDITTQTYILSDSIGTQTSVAAKVASTQTMVLSRSVTTQTTQFIEPSPVVQGTALRSTLTRSSSTFSSSSSSSTMSSSSTSSDSSVRSSDYIGNAMQRPEYPLRDSFKKLTKERQFHYTTIRTKLDQMVSILSRRNRLASSYLNCDSARYGMQRSIMHSSLLNLREGNRFAPNV
ncbi:protein FAM83D [Bombina bombina]|uniref:protein FAM83D n=1 Tax=Bombina bombina TaxID=8345 RepID=UPI00235ABC71|nr:protein FAM83D [Bombina bombina]